VRLRRPAPVERRVSGFLSQPPTVRNAMSVIVSITTFVVVLAGVAVWILDHQEYSTLWIGLWWALQTVTTVGYGDVAPAHLSGRLIGAVVMLQGIAFIAIITALLTSTFVTRASAEYRVRESAEELSDRELIERRLDTLEEKLDKLIARN